MILAHRGFDVEVIEKASVVGGRSAVLSFGGFDFDTAHVSHDEFVLDEMFAEAGEDIDNLLETIELNPMYRLISPTAPST